MTSTSRSCSIRNYATESEQSRLNISEPGGEVEGIAYIFKQLQD